MPRVTLPLAVSVHEGASYVPCCDLCGWIGPDCWTPGDAHQTALAHARSDEHLANAR